MFTLLATAAFTFLTVKDPFTDEVSYQAVLYGSRNTEVRVYCGSDTKGLMAVNLFPGMRVRGSWSGFARYSMRLRFDSQETYEVNVAYSEEGIGIFDKDARRVISDMKSSRMMLVDLDGFSQDGSTMSVPLEGAPEALDELARHCRG